MRSFLLCLFLALPSLAYAAPSAPTQSVDPLIARGINGVAKFIEQEIGASNRAVGIVPFTNIGEETQKLRVGEVLATLITQRLVKSKTVRVAETQDMKRILNEIRLGSLGVIDSKTAVKAGGIMGAQLMLSGSVIPAGEFYQLAVRLNDVETAQTLGTFTVEIPRRRLIALSRDVYNLHQGWYEAPLRSLLIPGWGQFYNERPVRGTFYLVTTAALLGAAVYVSYDADRKLDAYRAADAEKANHAYDVYRHRVRLTQGLAWTGAALWAVNVLDGGIFGAPADDVTLSWSGSEVHLAYRF